MVRSINPFDGPGPEMVRVEFESTRGTTFIDRIVLKWIEKETRGRGDFTLEERAARAFAENLWVIESSAIRQGEYVDAPRASSIEVEELDDDPLTLRVRFSE